MKNTFSDSQTKDVYSRLEKSDSSLILHPSSFRNPVHVVYGGANLFKADTPNKLGKLALQAQAISCGALTAGEITEATGLTTEELSSTSFAKIMEKRREI